MKRNDDSTVLLEARNLCASHGQLVAVREVSLQLKAGEVVALVGSNGAGKTTLLRTLAGAHPAGGGSVQLAGTDVTREAAHRRVQQGLALVPEGRRLFADMTVRSASAASDWALRASACTSSPSARRRSTTAAPMPEEAPVTSAVR